MEQPLLPNCSLDRDSAHETLSSSETEAKQGLLYSCLLHYRAGMNVCLHSCLHSCFASCTCTPSTHPQAHPSCKAVRYIESQQARLQVGPVDGTCFMQAISVVCDSMSGRGYLLKALQKGTFQLATALCEPCLPSLHTPPVSLPCTPSPHSLQSWYLSPQCPYHHNGHITNSMADDKNNAEHISENNMGIPQLMVS